MDRCCTLTALTAKPQKLLDELMGLTAVLGCRVLSLKLGEKSATGLAPLTVKVQGSERGLETLAANLADLEHVSLSSAADESGWNQELVLVKVAAEPGTLDEVYQCAAVFAAETLAEAEDYVVFKATGPSQRVEAFVQTLSPYGILEMGRTGQVTLEPWTAGGPCGGSALDLGNLSLRTDEATHLA